MDMLEAVRRGDAAIHVIAKRPGGDLVLVTHLIDRDHPAKGLDRVLDQFHAHIESLDREANGEGPRKRDAAQQRREGLVEVFEKIARNEHLNKRGRSGPRPLPASASPLAVNDSRTCRFVRIQRFFVYLPACSTLDKWRTL